MHEGYENNSYLHMHEGYENNSYLQYNIRGLAKEVFQKFYSFKAWNMIC